VKVLVLAVALVAPGPPAPDALLPQAPAAVAQALGRTTASLQRALVTWQAGPRAARPAT